VAVPWPVAAGRPETGPTAVEMSTNWVLFSGRPDLPAGRKNPAARLVRNSSPQVAGGTGQAGGRSPVRERLP
jgi:hypothetical protein